MAAKQFPLIGCTQRIVIYETKARYYVVGSNNIETRFRVLKIDRTEPRELNIVDDKIEYTRKEIRDLLLMIDVGNRPKQQSKNSSGLARTVSAFGIVGFVRFLEGYYIILITKRKRVALIGYHFIYKIEDTTMLYIPNDDTVRYPHQDEQKYLKMFLNVDLSSNFYFSYSYDLTHTLQYNMTPCKGLRDDPVPSSPEEQLRMWKTGKRDRHVHRSLSDSQDVEDANTTVQNFLDVVGRERKSSDSDVDSSPESNGRRDRRSPGADDFVYGIKPEPYKKYVWNLHLLKHVIDNLHPDWILFITHGFIGQSSVMVFGRPLYLSLIARRSNRFAGTRFLKRGANYKGDVANEVETEQIVQSMCSSSLEEGDITSFVQLRGSIPLFWSQDISKMVPRPSITIDMNDTFGYTAGNHFNDVLRRYGAPVIIFNLVKKREKKKHESILTEEILKTLEYLNQFLSPKQHIKYIGFDMARVSKSKTENVLLRLAEIAEQCVKQTGYFHSGQELFCNKLREHPRCNGLKREETSLGCKQQGVVRTNCVDCLDRTNTAQFAIGKVALAFQLHALGIIEEPLLAFDTDCVRMLEDLYEDQGDTLALQYGGSQLVHRIKGYRNLAPWTSSSRDIMQTLSRYYSNAFSDADKQNAINIFLGIFKPEEIRANIWELPTDYYMHNKFKLRGKAHGERPYSQWCEMKVARSLPLPYDEVSKGVDPKPLVIITHADDERVNAFWEYYKPYELTSLDELYSFCMPNSIKDFMPKFATSFSPFSVRARPGRRQEEFGSSTTEANPNVSGRESTTSTTSAGSEGSESNSSDSDIDGDLDFFGDSDFPKEESGLSLVSLKDLFPTMAQTYGVEIKPPAKESIAAYKKFVDIGSKSQQEVIIEGGVRTCGKATDLVQRSIFPLDSTQSVEPPIVSLKSREIYDTYAKHGRSGADLPSKRNMQIYQRYLLNKYM